MAARVDVDSARRILAGHGLIAADVPVGVQRLAGGVSSETVLVTAGDQSFVLKRPLERFAVRDEWIVPVSRVRVEFEAAWFLESQLGEEAVVPVLLLDEPTSTLVMRTAPHGWRTWKERLLAGQVGTGTARAAGRLLARIHGLAAGLDVGAFRNEALFEAQRLDPYFRTAAARVPEAGGALDVLVARFGARDDLVHGDFSPKNLFTDPAMSEVRLIDHEVVTRGDAAFDVAFCLTHLLLKAIHLDAHRAALHESARAFVEAYMNNRAEDAADPPYARETRAMAYVGGLLLARVVGKSPAEYLDDAGRRRARSLALRILGAGDVRLDAVLAWG